jgi:aerobic-type carbon monoxide dehydrogenase small subunit (CoxS/CutS family)
MAKLSINGQTVDIDVEPDMPLLWAIRENIGLSGTKYGCGIRPMRRLHGSHRWRRGAIL